MVVYLNTTDLIWQARWRGLNRGLLYSLLFSESRDDFSGRCALWVERLFLLSSGASEWASEQTNERSGFIFQWFSMTTGAVFQKIRCSTAKNRDVSTRPLARPFAHHVHSFDCSALLTLLARSTKIRWLTRFAALTRSLTQSLPSLRKNVILMWCETGCSEPKYIWDVRTDRRVYRWAYRWTHSF